MLYQNPKKRKTDSIKRKIDGRNEVNASQNQKTAEK